MSYAVLLVLVHQVQIIQTKAVARNREHHIKITCPCNKYPLEPHFYIAKLGYAGKHFFFLR